MFFRTKSHPVFLGEKKAVAQRESSAALAALFSKRGTLDAQVERRLEFST